MTIATLDDYRKALKQRVLFQKTGVQNSAGGYLNGWNIGAFPAAGTSPGNTANGIVPDDTTTGAPTIQPFSGNGYITGCRWECTRGQGDTSGILVMVFDYLFGCGAYTAAATQTLTSQPSYSARLPTVGGNPDYTGLMLWYENNTLSGSSGTLTITYTDQDGNTGHSTSQGVNLLTGSGVTNMQLAAGDVGIRKIESVSMAGSGLGGTWSVQVLRPLFWVCITPGAFPTGELPLETIKMPQIFDTSCLRYAYRDWGTSGGNKITLDIEIASL